MNGRRIRLLGEVFRQTLILLAVAIPAHAGGLPAPSWSVHQYVPARGAVGLQWTTVEGASAYALFRKAEGEPDFSLVATQPDSRYLDAQVRQGVTYRYLVRAVDSSGMGPPSPEVSVRAFDAAARPPPAPTWVETLVERNREDGGWRLKVNLLWAPGDGIIAYNVQRKVGEGDFAYLTTTTSPRYSDDTVVEGETYGYRLTALNGLMLESAPSEVRSVRLETLREEASTAAPNKLRLVPTRVVRVVTGGDEVPLKAPVDLARSPAGRIYVLDNQLPGVLSFDFDGEFRGVLAGGAASGEPVLRSPYGIDAAPDGSLWVTDRKRSSEVLNLDSTGRLRSSFVFATPPHEETLERMDPRCRGEAPFALDVAVTPDGELLLTDNTFHRVCRFDARGTYLGEFGLPGSGPGEFNRPSKIAVDPEGRIFVLDSQNRRVQAFDPGGAHLFDIGRSNTMVGAFLGLSGIAFVDGESVIVADSPMATVQAFSLRDGTYQHHFGHEDLRVDESGQRALWDVITPAGLLYDPSTRRIWFGMPMEHALCVREVIGGP